VHVDLKWLPHRDQAVVDPLCFVHLHRLPHHNLCVYTQPHTLVCVCVWEGGGAGGGGARGQGCKGEKGDGGRGGGALVQANVLLTLFHELGKARNLR
jgi:hypothetical protein